MSELMIVGNPPRRKKRKVRLSVRGKRRVARSSKRRGGKRHKRVGPRRYRYGGKLLYGIQIISKYGKVKGRKILARFKKKAAKRIVRKGKGRKSLRRALPARLRLTCRMASVRHCRRR